jgi:hypothetical protein
MRILCFGVGVLLLACSGSVGEPAASADGESGGGGGNIGGSGGAGVGAGIGGGAQVAGSAGQANGGGAGSAVVGTGGAGVGQDGGTGACASGSVAMPLLSKTAPVFASSGPAVYNGPDKGSDWDYKTSWGPTKLPAWIASDLSAASMSQREQVLVVWNAPHAAGYINDKIEAYSVMPIDYTIEVNAAPGGAMPPATGWTEVANVKSNIHSTAEHLVALGKNNWVRMSITSSSDPTGALALDLDVYSAPCGASDAWMFMGDSITYITMSYAFSDLPPLAHAAKPSRWPVAINAALGGTNTTTAMSIIDNTMAGYPGRFVILAYGTNDHAAELKMETLVQKVIAAGKTPVVPHMPWSNSANIQKDGPLINQQIDALYKKYPAILPGPDLWATFMDRTDLIPAGDVHPNGPGQVELRKTWANFIAGVP